MSDRSIRTRIEAALAQLPSADFAAAAQDLLAVLGYRSERTIAEQSGTVVDFMSLFGAEETNTTAELAFRKHAGSARLLFQLTDTEIATAGQLHIPFADADRFHSGLTRSFFLVAVELNGQNYPRGKYAQFTREINKWSRSPTVVLFKSAAGLLTLAFVRRREHKRNPKRDVLGKVSLVREIDPKQPHQAHVRILEELSLVDRLKWMDTHHEPHNFDGLLAAWLDALDTEELNRRFYKELFAWFERAVTVARFPTKGARILPPEDHIIRLITRILFVWFIKEKNLIADELFNETQVAGLLRDYDPSSGKSYYRAVLQNLFFATLNTEMDRRAFSKQTNDTHRDFSKYRYECEMSDPERLLALFRQTPFINGGLFDCLDSEEGSNAGGYRIDCFTDNVNDPKREEYGILSIPNRLFFDNDGLITLFNRYKFTVEENTPAEQEVALDPELLGKVFENLLAVVTPESSETARKQTGSYYTPRTVVDYMVDESLVATLAEKCAPEVGDAEFWRDRLRYLLDYDDAFDDADELFTPTERECVVRSVAKLKVIDPAVGSGAFPMGILHKLTLALRRLDAENEQWETLQRDLAVKRAAAAFDTDDQTERNDELTEISETFEKYRSSDFGRKLYLIQNSIFGVDIQPVACQIAKLRFFISLAIEQEPTGDAGDNFGIKPLPNLETRFVAADTLLALEKPAQRTLGETDAVARLEQELNTNRERHFHATTRPQKLACRCQDKQLRQQLADTLKKAAFSADAADKVAQWDPYDQNASADWFDAEYMFGVSKGFDVVIGNPPYIQLQKNGGKLAALYKDSGFQTFARTGDIYYLFFEKGVNLLRRNTGHACFISSNQWMRVDSGRSLRKFFERHDSIRLVNLGAGVFDNVTVNTSVLLVSRLPRRNALQAADVRGEVRQFPPTEWTQIHPINGETWVVMPKAGQSIRDKMDSVGAPLRDWGVKINRGIITGYNKAFIIDSATRNALVAEEPISEEIIRPVLRGRDFGRYRAQWAGLWLIDTHNGYGDVVAIEIADFPAVRWHLDEYYPQLEKRQDKGRSPYNLRNCAFHEEFSKDKIAWGNLNNRAKFSYAPKGMFVNAPATFLTPFSHYLLAVLNSKLLDWYFRLIGVERDGGYYEYKPMFIERLPVPQISAQSQAHFIQLVEYILSTKESDTAAQEAQIDQLVYELYGLSNDEISLIESQIVS